MLSKKLKVSNTAIFRIPVINMDMTWENIVEQYPHMVSEMDGSDVGSCLLVYYCKNPVNGIYEFVDEDAEADMSDIFGFDIDICTKGESKLEVIEREAQVDVMAFEDDDEYHNLPEFDETREKDEIKTRKQQKKERRLKIVEIKVHVGLVI